MVFRFFRGTKGKTTGFRKGNNGLPVPARVDRLSALWGGRFPALARGGRAFCSGRGKGRLPKRGAGFRFWQGAGGRFPKGKQRTFGFVGKTGCRVIGRGFRLCREFRRVPIGKQQTFAICWRRAGGELFRITGRKANFISIVAEFNQ